MSESAADGMGQIVALQGSLIFLSAVVAAISYVIQSRLAIASRSRELALERTEKYRASKLGFLQRSLETIIGPAQSLVHAGDSMLWEFACAKSGFRLEDHFSKLLGGQDKVQEMFEGKICEVPTFLLQRDVDAVVRQPDSPVAQEYRLVIRAALQDFYRPAAEILKRQMNQLRYPTRAHFREQYPALADNIYLRKFMLLQFLGWVSSMSQLVKEWDKGNYARALPAGSRYPLLLNEYLIDFVDRLKQRISRLTDGHITEDMASWDDERAEIFDHVMSTLKPGGRPPVRVAGTPVDRQALLLRRRRRKHRHRNNTNIDTVTVSEAATSGYAVHAEAESAAESAKEGSGQ